VHIVTAVQDYARARRHLSRPSEIITIQASDRTGACTPLVPLTDNAEVQGCSVEVEELNWLFAVILGLSNRTNDRREQIIEAFSSNLKV